MMPHPADPYPADQPIRRLELQMKPPGDPLLHTQGRLQDEHEVRFAVLFTGPVTITTRRDNRRTTRASCFRRSNRHPGIIMGSGRITVGPEGPGSALGIVGSAYAVIVPSR